MATAPHGHQMVIVTNPPKPGEESDRQLWGCHFGTCAHTEVICRLCVVEGRAKSILGSHTHAADGTITRALASLSKVNPIRPPGYVAPIKMKTPRKRRGNKLF